MSGGDKQELGQTKEVGGILITLIHSTPDQSLPSLVTKLTSELCLCRLPGLVRIPARSWFPWKECGGLHRVLAAA